jgi:hypothetical protein
MVRLLLQIPSLSAAGLPATLIELIAATNAQTAAPETSRTEARFNPVDEVVAALQDQLRQAALDSGELVAAGTGDVPSDAASRVALSGGLLAELKSIVDHSEAFPVASPTSANPESHDETVADALSTHFYVISVADLGLPAPPHGTRLSDVVNRALAAAEQHGCDEGDADLDYTADNVVPTSWLLPSTTLFSC